MKTYNLAFLGFGNVGQALARLFMDKEAELKEKYGLGFTVTAIATGSHGRAIDKGGIDLETALDLMAKGSSLDALSAQPAPEDNVAFIQACGADALFENTPLILETTLHDIITEVEKVLQTLFERE